MNKAIHIQTLNPADQPTIQKIANWYYNEWQTPIQKTIDRLSGGKESGLHFQLVAVQNDEVIATGGLSDQVNLLNVYPEYQQYGPWVALLYTEEACRQQGIGKTLLKHIESEARALQLDKIYLYTFTAEAMYQKSGWQTIDTVQYKGHQTVIMEKG